MEEDGTTGLRVHDNTIGSKKLVMNFELEEICKNFTFVRDCQLRLQMMLFFITEHSLNVDMLRVRNKTCHPENIRRKDYYAHGVHEINGMVECGHKSSFS